MNKEMSRMTSGTAMSNATRQKAGFFKSIHLDRVNPSIDIAFNDQGTLEQGQNRRCDRSFIHAVHRLSGSPVKNEDPMAVCFPLD